MHETQQMTLIILNITLIEIILSIDNASVLATMVIHLPENQRQKALQYGILGAYVFRGVAMLLAKLIISFWLLKPLAGGYLIYLCYDNFANNKKSENKRSLNTSFWMTVASVEFMDLTFSIDNIFAVMSYTKNIQLIYIGVSIGILAVRFVAQAFIKVLEVYPILEKSAYFVIGLLGLKMTITTVCSFGYFMVLESEAMDILTSAITAISFAGPIGIIELRKWLKKKK